MGYCKGFCVVAGRYCHPAVLPGMRGNNQDLRGYRDLGGRAEEGAQALGFRRDPALDLGG